MNTSGSLGLAHTAQVALRFTLVAVAARPDQPKLLAIGAEHTDCPGFPIPIADRAGPENRLALLSFLGQKSDVPIVVLSGHRTRASSFFSCCIPLVLSLLDS